MSETGKSILRAFQPRSAVLTGVVALFILSVLCAGCISILMQTDLPAPALSLTFSLGFIGLWRWGWGGLHVLRAQIYRHFVYPTLRAKAEQVSLPSRLYAIVTSYRMDAEMNFAVYDRLLEQVAELEIPTTIIACISDPADAEVIDLAFRRRTEGLHGVHLILEPQRGLGKRDAMVSALHYVAQDLPPADSMTLLMDGDSLLGPGVLELSLRMLVAHPDVGAVTTQNIPLVRGAGLVREWYRLRMAQRHQIMCSMSLSRRLLVLTGRFSVFRSEVTVTPDFVLGLDGDEIEHWRLGSIRMVTGDDKSTWFSVLKQGWKMLYLPDVHIYPLEELPPGGFLAGTQALMVRWFGNMVRNIGRAIALGPGRVGGFIWWSLIDQRLSMWTALIGPITALLVAVLYSWQVLAAYVLWILASRLVNCVMIFLLGGVFHPWFPLLLYYNQFVGALIKIYMTFFPHLQRWTRQRAIHHGDPQLEARNASSRLFMTLAVVIFVLSVVVLRLELAV